MLDHFLLHALVCLKEVRHLPRDEMDEVLTHMSRSDSVQDWHMVLQIHVASIHSHSFSVLVDFTEE